MAETQPASGLTTPAPGTTHDVPAPTRRRVVYKFSFPTHHELKLPYAVAVDGVVEAQYDTPSIVTEGSPIELLIAPGSRVALYIGSDSQKAFRARKVYEVIVGQSDVELVVTEKPGKHGDPDAPVLREVRPGRQGGVATEVYAAPLTGDIWMSVSHRYSEAEAEALLPAGTEPAIRGAILSIYKGLTAATVTAPGTAGAALAPITMKFSDSSNPVANITAYTLLRDGLPRVHPKAFLALFEAARRAEVLRLTVSSDWRPLEGSIAHRVGLGIDVNYIEDASGVVRLNRAELRGAEPDLPWVTDEEKRLFGEYEAAKARTATAEAEHEAASLEQRRARGEAEKTAAAGRADAAQRAFDTAKADENRAKSAWGQERDRNEPKVVKAFRAALKNNELVRQIIDPWLIDTKTRDNVDYAPNEQRKGNLTETGHANHLHVTVREPGLL